MTTPRPTSEAEGTNPRREQTDAGGESACWVHLVCDECGALEHDGHHDGCSQAPPG